MQTSKLTQKYDNWQMKNIKFYKKTYTLPYKNVYGIIKQKPHLNDPKMLDTMYFSLPVRDIHSGSYQNMLLAFLCKKHSETFCEMYNDESHLLNNQEYHVNAISQSYDLTEISFNSLILNVPLVVICNSYCANQREPFYEVYIDDTCTTINKKDDNKRKAK